MKQIRMENGIILYYGNKVGRVEGGRAVVDPMFRGTELDAFLDRQKNIQEVKWKDGVFDRLMSRHTDSGEMQALKNCRVWQLRPDVDIRKKFIEYEKLLHDFGTPDPGDYQMVFDGEVETNDLEGLYAKFNLDHPPGYTGHSLSMSDVLELYDEEGSTFHYVDRFGFKQVDFSDSAPQMGHTMQL
uniref:YodL domain-containing protein n=1 Tax=Enterocloster clostridioformis TaxID=1531 RepID=UPI0026EB81BD|nr:YodL domain-containing protein [Enterocloster clostridioformis]